MRRRKRVPVCEGRADSNARVKERVALSRGSREVCESDLLRCDPVLNLRVVVASAPNDTSAALNLVRVESGDGKEYDCLVLNKRFQIQHRLQVRRELFPRLT